MAVLTEHRSTIIQVSIGAEGGSLIVSISYTIRGRIDSFAYFGVTTKWLASFFCAIAPGPICLDQVAGSECRIRVDDKLNLAEIGRLDGTNWFKVQDWPSSPPSPLSLPWEGWTLEGVRALRYLNKQRALVGRRPLDPAAAGYTNDDIIADALHYGWQG